MKFVGYYNQYGYQVFEFETGTNDGNLVYNAGNSPYDSQENVPVSKGLSLETLKNFCEQTTKEIATENKGTFIGIEYEQPIDENEF